MKIHFESILIAIGIVLVIFASLIHLNHTQTIAQRQPPPHIYAKSKMKTHSIDARVEQLRREIGDRLNRERIQAQYQNLGEASSASRSAKDWHPDPVLAGNPLSGERHPMHKDDSIKAIPSAESQLHNIVQYEENLQNWENEARAQYVAQFVMNAEALGYKVQIDRDLNVYWEYIGERSPQNAELQIPFIIRAPICAR